MNSFSFFEWPQTWQHWVLVYLLVGYGFVLFLVVYGAIRKYLKRKRDRLFWKEPSVNLSGVLTDSMKRRQVIKKMGALNLYAIIWPVVVGVGLDMYWDTIKPKPPRPYWEHDPCDMDSSNGKVCESFIEDLVERVDPHSVAASNLIKDPLGRTPSVPFGHLNPGWMRLINDYKASDALWSFEIKPVMSGNYEIRSFKRGYALVREGKVIDELVIEWS